MYVALFSLSLATPLFTTPVQEITQVISSHESRTDFHGNRIENPLAICEKPNEQMIHVFEI